MLFFVMDKILTITAITLVAVIMGFSAVAPAIAQEPPRGAAIPCESLERVLVNAGVDERTILLILAELGCI